MWLGATLLGNDWVNLGKAGKWEKLAFTQWAPGEPNYSSKNEECLALCTYANAYTNQWNDLHCNDYTQIKGYICEKSA